MAWCQLEGRNTTSIKTKDFEFWHYEVGNKSSDQVCSLVRRWYFSKAGRGNPCIIAYDYIKLTGERVGANWAEHQAIGEKIDKLKKENASLKQKGKKLKIKLTSIETKIDELLYKLQIF